MPKPFQVRDEYFFRAKEKGYRARSAFKLLEIQQKFKLLKRGGKVVDLGAAPGSFMQVILEFIGDDGKVLGVDLQRIDSLDCANAVTAVGDIMETEKMMGLFEKADFSQVNVLTSDLAPKTSGIKDVDQGLSVELTDQAFYLATQILKPGGHFVGKVFEGADLPWLLKRVKKRFKKVSLFKPKACRDRSSEKYIVGIRFKTQP
jgi:23S rRNA (uridine2552-2'-O)-methyltransferase